jgi:hypothetical protein
MNVPVRSVAWALLSSLSLFAGQIGLFGSSAVHAEDATAPRATGASADAPGGRSPIFLANRPAVPSDGPSVAGEAKEHPLMPVIRWAREGLPALEKVNDYSATFISHERVSGKLYDEEYARIKIRQRPFSVRASFLRPASIAGREATYVEGRNAGRMLVRLTGIQRFVGVLSLEPDGPLAMSGHRYPINEIGLLNLVRRLLEIAEKDLAYGECEVRVFHGARINDRACTWIEVTHPVRRSYFTFHVARIFVDDRLNLPVRYEAYDFPAAGGAPQLIEQYSYLDLKFNNGYTDADFELKKPKHRDR